VRKSSVSCCVPARNGCVVAWSIVLSQSIDSSLGRGPADSLTTINAAGRRAVPAQREREPPITLAPWTRLAFRD
jgi:hypothetical protein